MCSFYLVSLKIFLSLVFRSHIVICPLADFFVFFLLGFSQILESVDLCLSSKLGIFQPLFLQIFSTRIPFLLSFWDSNDVNLNILLLSHSSLRLCLLFSQFIICFLHWVISIDLYQI